LGFIVCYDIDNVHTEVNIRDDPGFQVGGRGALKRKFGSAPGTSIQKLTDTLAFSFS
jgi:hypothetical protein